MKQAAFTSNRFFLFILSIFCIITAFWSFASAAPRKGATGGGEAVSLADSWMEAIHTLNIDQYVSQYWDDAKQLYVEPNGVVYLFEGKQAIYDQQNTIFRNYGDAMASYVFPKPEFMADEITDTPQIVFKYENAHLIYEVLRLEERGGQTKIAEQWIFSRLFDPFPETGELNAWADNNGNGLLDIDEQINLFNAVKNVMFSPGKVSNPLDEFFDWNENGKVDEVEAELARFELLRNRMRRIELFDEEFARQRTGLQNGTEVKAWNANQLLDNTLNKLKPGPLQDETWKAADFNSDDRISFIELEAYQDLVCRIAAVNNAPVLYTRSTYGFIDDIRKWADVDRDFTISDNEREDVILDLMDLIQYRDLAGSPVSRFFDRNRDTMITPEERDWTIDFVVYFLLPNALEQRIAVYNWFLNKEMVFTFNLDNKDALSQAEIDEMRDLLKTFDEQVWQKNDPDGTTHRWIDLDGNGVVETDESASYLQMLFMALFTAWLRLPEEEANSMEVRTMLDKTADIDNDGLLSMRERQDLIDALRRPHGVQTGADRMLDLNSDGSLSMEEIGRARESGNIPVNTVLTQRMAQPSAPLSPQASTAGGKSGTEASVIKPIALRGSTLAVLGVQDTTNTLKAGQTDLLISFLENAFVNFGNTAVVDRQNLAKIMEEYRFQSSAFSNDETAVEIGKLSGADVIAVAKLNSLADTYYLHLKVINVKTGTIIGSSISEGTSEKQFLNMCNAAVRPLF
ncbi:MAG: hypothetical protein E4H36_02020 [Spirochaetales bacterium]|nr:MAG: hypothetical protein E4H36_02020 [Spirochaetales bacterium]